MDLLEKIHFEIDDFKIIDILKELPPDKITGNQQILRHIQENTYGKDYGAVFGNEKYNYLLYKFGELNDSGLLLIYTKKEDSKLLTLYVENGEKHFPDSEIRKMLLEQLKTV